MPEQADAERADGPRHARLPGGSDDSRTDQVIDLWLILGRVRRLARLDPAVFREVRDDASQTLGAGLVVLASRCCWLPWGDGCG
ncbi:MAG: hypothetical protein DK306_000810 [Chloroflexi bacterium]|jgi:hypothetical protein|nr:MAG: hypothetical protein DK306_000810 [Chloroflexota bacterium]